MVSQELYYWISRFDNFRFICTLLLIIFNLFGASSFAFLITFKLNDEENDSTFKWFKKCFYSCLIIVILSLSGLIWIPTTNEGFKMIGTNIFDVKVEMTK